LQRSSINIIITTSERVAMTIAGHHPSSSDIISVAFGFNIFVLCRKSPIMFTKLVLLHLL